MAGRFTAVGIELVIRGMTQWTQGNKTLRRQMGLTGAQIKRMSNQFGGASSAILSFGNNIRNVGNQALILGFQLSFLASGAMLAVIAQGVKFEKSMVKIITLVGVAEQQVAQWADQLLDLAPALGRSPTELAEALFVITSAGIRDQAEAIDVLTQSAKAASIGLGETEAVARVVTGVMQAYGEENISAAETVDILVSTIREGNLEVESLAPTLGRVIATAANMGVTFAEVGAFIATFSRTAVPAEVAVTSLRAALNAILKPTAGAEAKLAEYGIAMSDIWEAIRDPERGLHDTLLALSLVFGDANEEMAEVIGSARGLAGIFTVTGGLAEEYVEIFEEITASLGITNEAFDRFAETTSFMAASAKASLETLAITIGAVLLPGINKVLEVLIPFFNKLRDLAELHPKIVILVGVLGAFVTVLGPLLIITGLLISSLGTFIIAIGALATFISALITGPFALLAAAFVAVFAGISVAIGISLGEAQAKLDAKGQSLTRSAFTWGSNIVLSLARGLGAAAAAVTRVLILIGEHIRFLLRSYSPPRLLPDIELWGQRTMETWIEGWLKADFGKFNEIAGLVEAAIRSLTFDKELGGLFSDVEGLTAIIGARTGIAGAIEQIRETGEVTKNTLEELFDPSIVGSSSEALKNYVVSLLALDRVTEELTAAQRELNDAEEHFTSILDPLNKQLDRTQKRFKQVLRELNDELNRTTQEFADALKPIDEEIRGLEDAKQAIIDQREREALLELIANASTPEQTKEVARMRLRHMELVKQRDAIVDERDAATDAAKEKIDAAEELRDAELEALKARIAAEEELRDTALESIQLRVDAAQEAVDAAQEIVDILEEQIRVQIENNELLKEYAQLLESSKKGTKGLADAVGDLADVLGDGLPAFGGAGADREGEEEGGPGLFEDIQRKTEELIIEIEKLLAAAKQEFLDSFGDTSIVTELKDIWSDIIVDSIRLIDQGRIEAVLRSFFLGTVTGALVGISDEISARLKQEVTRYFERLAKSAKKAFIDPFIALGTLLSDFLGGEPNVTDLVNDFADAIFNMTDAIYELIVLVSPIDPQPLFDLINFLVEKTGFGDAASEWLTGIGVSIGDITGALAGTGPGGKSQGVIDALWQTAQRLEFVRVKSDELNKELQNNLTPAYVDGLTPAMGGLQDKIQRGTGPAVDGLTKKFGHQKIAVDRDLHPAITTLNDFLVEHLGPTIGNKIAGVVVDVKDKFLDWRAAIKNKAQKAIETLEEFLGVDFSETMSNVSTFLDETFSPAVEFLQERWELLKDAFAGPITTAFNAFRTAVLDPITKAVDNVKTSIGDALTKVGELINKLPFIKIPDLLDENSPSPFEQAIRNVMAAMDEMTNDAAPALAASMRGELGTFMASGQSRRGRMSAMPMRHGGMVSNRETNVNLGGQTINNGMDAASFQALIERAMRNSI